MKLSVEKALQFCGNNNRYQKLFFIAVALTWFSVDFVSISFPLLELMPDFQCKNEKGIFKDCDAETFCKLTDPNDYKIGITYANILTDQELYCQKTFVILIGVIYTLGILLGAILSSKYSDILGRKPVLLLCQFLFACGAFAITFAPNVYFVLGILFFIGISSAGGTMVSFLYIYEILAPNKRSLYGTLINSSFAIAGMIYFTLFKYLKNWRYIAWLSCCTDIIAGLLILTYFTESPRYLLSKGETEKALKALYKIAKRNGKGKDFYKYLVSDLTIQDDDRSKSPHYVVNPDNCHSSSSTTETFIHNDTTGNSKIGPYDHSNGESPKINYKINMEEVARSLRREENNKSTGKDQPFLLDESNTFNNEKPIREAKKEPGFLALVKYKSLRHSFLTCNLLWFIGAFTYYGISLDLKKDKDDVFISGYIVYGAEGISYMITGIIMSIAFFGRVRSLTIMFFLTAISTLSYFIFRYFNLMPYDKIMLFMARFSITSITSLMYTYSTEVYPTVIRAKGLGINTLFARFAVILVPIIVELIDPYLIFAVMCLFGLFFTFNLPETFGKELEDEIFEEKSRKSTACDSTFG
jgi:MFS family permease